MKHYVIEKLLWCFFVTYIITEIALVILIYSNIIIKFVQMLS